ncbi:MAG: hypothetical protein KGH63_01605 [Candidatus Micrarchaeota archaeon]|nr:hypothetical protein [Candidatus Micrarchaeota archaeon]
MVVFQVFAPEKKQAPPLAEPQSEGPMAAPPVKVSTPQIAGLIHQSYNDGHGLSLSMDHMPNGAIVCFYSQEAEAQRPLPEEDRERIPSDKSPYLNRVADAIAEKFAQYGLGAAGAAAMFVTVEDPAKADPDPSRKGPEAVNARIVKALQDRLAKKGVPGASVYISMAPMTLGRLADAVESGAGAPDWKAVQSVLARGEHAIDAHGSLVDGKLLGEKVFGELKSADTLEKFAAALRSAGALEIYFPQNEDADVEKAYNFLRTAHIGPKVSLEVEGSRIRFKMPKKYGGGELVEQVWKDLQGQPVTIVNEKGETFSYKVGRIDGQQAVVDAFGAELDLYKLMDRMGGTFRIELNGMPLLNGVQIVPPNEIKHGFSGNRLVDGQMANEQIDFLKAIAPDIKAAYESLRQNAEQRAVLYDDIKFREAVRQAVARQIRSRQAPDVVRDVATRDRQGESWTIDYYQQLDDIFKLLEMGSGAVGRDGQAAVADLFESFRPTVGYQNPAILDRAAGIIRTLVSLDGGPAALTAATPLDAGQLQSAVRFYRLLEGESTVASADHVEHCPSANAVLDILLACGVRLNRAQAQRQLHDNYINVQMDRQDLRYVLQQYFGIPAAVTGATVLGPAGGALER